MKHLYTVAMCWTVLFMLLGSTPVQAQCTLACNDQVQVSIPDEGFAVVLPEMILDDDTSCPGPKVVVVHLPNGQSIGDTVTCDYVNDLLNVMVIDANSGNFCWGSILVEDKLRPIIECRDTTVNCTADLDPDSLNLTTVADNCDSDPTVTFVENISPQACSTLLTQIVTRTWYASDDSGNIAFPCEQTISITRPELSDVIFPPNFDGTDEPALPCESADTSIANTGFPMVDSLPIGELCKISAAYEDFVVYQCDVQFSVFREWTVLDCCSGEILTHTQHLKVVDVDGPELDCPASLTVSANGPDCEGYFALPAVAATDNCSADISFRTLTPVQVIEGNGGPIFGLPLGTYFVTYEATDGCLNQSTCEVELIVADDVAPIAVCDEITTVSLGSQGIANVPAGVFDDGSYDACCPVDILAKRMDEPNAPFAPNVQLDCADLGDTVMVIVQVTDCYDNSNTCMVEAIPDDKTAPTINCPADVTIDCWNWPADPTALGEPTVQDNCGIDTLVFSDSENLNLCSMGTITRTFTVTDLSGYTASCSHTITTIDTTAVQYFFPADTAVDCSVPLDSISAGEVFAIADCELIGLNVEDEIFYPEDCVLKIFRTYTFLDWCSGFDTSYTQFIEVIDTNPPMWEDPLGSKDTAYVCPGDLVKPPPPTAMDFCFSAEVTLELDTTIYDGCEGRYERTIIYSAVDDCGNAAEPFVITLIVNDTVAPTADLPDQGPFACFDDLPPFDTLSVPAVDNCLNAEVAIDTVSQSPYFGECMATVVRTWRLTDECGNDTLVMQNFLINDTLPPVWDVPLGSQDSTFACSEDLVKPPPPTATDSCFSAVVAVERDTVIFLGCVNRFERIITYSAVDDCGNEAVPFVVTLTVNDTIPPTATFEEIGPFTCLEHVPGPDPNDVIPSDNCFGDVTVDLISENIDSMGCMFELRRQWMLTDICGNDTTLTQLILVNDTIPPTLDCPDSVVANIFNDVCEVGVGVTVTALDNCDGPVVITNDYSGGNGTIDGTFGIGTTLVTFYAQDTCGNLESCVVPIIVNDMAPPSNFCTSFDQNLGPAIPTVINVDSLVAAGEFGGEDFCSDVTFDFSPASVSCDDYTGDPTPVSYTLVVTDASGLTSSCSNTMFLWDPDNVCPPFGPPVVGGRVFLDNETPMDGVEMQLEDAQGMMTTSTTADGIFLFENLPAGANCTLHPYKDDDLLNGVTTFDLVLITKHILGNLPITSPYRLIAADVNNSGGISTFDIVQLRKAVLQITDDFPNNTSWRFVEAGYDFPDPADPWLESFPEGTWLSNLSESEVGRNFIGVKIGDVNGSASTNFGGSLDERTSDELMLVTNDLQLQPGETITVPVFAGGEQELVALQTTLEYDTEKLTFLGLTGAALELHDYNFAEPKPGFVTLSWDEADGQVISRNSELFFIQFQIEESAVLREALHLNSHMTPAIAYKNGGDPLNILWQVHGALPVPVDTAEFFELAQNQPNPFSNETTVRFRLSEPMPVQLHVVDLTGRSRTVLDEPMGAGWHEVSLGRELFGANGIYTCQLVTPYGNERKRMVLAGK